MASIPLIDVVELAADVVLPPSCRCNAADDRGIVDGTEGTPPFPVAGVVKAGVEDGLGTPRCEFEAEAPVLGMMFGFDWECRVEDRPVSSEFGVIAPMAPERAADTAGDRCVLDGRDLGKLVSSCGGGVAGGDELEG